ncbi:uncharacterized protein BT62DRAFT_982273 [Guyanagaster necrorhizus]|uniref:PH domain-containing protein n=1 Tax=Guyanagaster necrorhizus TaxID=856835 RepID=A0A9P8APA6_9AGAR|nr:uncharacterized protein BT62DRAFT_982273 [Guyanagaster necrorhizus MCA 3950]KAG7443133.1 hypothetical protein BT62DRAFT_982273 [Guyanagaster necrorhizus MCA 3950]
MNDDESPRNGRSSGFLLPKSKGKGKEKALSDSLDDISSMRNFRNQAPLSFSSELPGSPRSPPTSPSRRSRGSLLVVASDALGFKFGRRRKSIRQSPMPIILPGVIEISAPRPDAELEERQQLRDAAAQAIGLTSSLLQPDPPPPPLEEEEPEDRQEYLIQPEVQTAESAAVPRSPQQSVFSLPVSAPFLSRTQAASMLTHSRSNSIAPTPIPPFPSSPAALSQFVQTSASLPKYYAPPSLRIFALSKQWRSRYLVLSSPATHVTTNSSPTVSYLHLFKTSNGEDKELERLEINEDSVVFMAEEEVGGRKHVIKVGGVDVGALKKDLNPEEGGRTMWFLQIVNQAESQRWITNIKQLIFGQRAVRAGLGSPGSTYGIVEPKGDMDVMLSMRAQGIVNSSTQNKLNVQEFHRSGLSLGRVDQTYSSASSSQSTRSQTPAAKPAPAGAVSTLKGLFSTTRPRSGSRSTSIDSERDGNNPTEDSFASMGSNLLSMSSQYPTTSTTLGTPIILPQDLERKIVDTDTLTNSWIPPTSIVNKDRATRALSMGAVPLQPPPRKRWTTSGAPSLDMGSFSQFNGKNEPGALISHDRSGTEPLPSPLANGHLFGTPEQKAREPSILSVSTLASGEHSSSTSTKRSSSVKRWSRQLPKRLTPPSGPPPAIPSSQSPSRPHPYAAGVVDRSDRPTSRNSYSATSGKSLVSTLPTFSKRASGCSALSVNTTSTSYSYNSASVSHTRPASSHRASMPPPRPAPTTALPPAPDQRHQRDSTSRGFRLSLMAPKPPPVGQLPPRPDETERRSRRASAGVSMKSDLYTIPSSPNPASAPLPPPVRPLPEPPLNELPASAPPASRATSFKQRLRILSAPSPLHISNGFHTPSPRSRHSTISPPHTPLSYISTSSPSTPINEKITYMQNDHSYLQLYTPITSSMPVPKMPTPTVHVPIIIDDEPQLRSLSPPPRRISKQVAVPEKEPVAVPQERSVTILPENIPLPHSRCGSVVSLGILTM